MDTTPPNTTTEQHPADELCYFCASDSQILRALNGRLDRTIHWQVPPTFCPTFSPAGGAQ